MAYQQERNKYIKACIIDKNSWLRTHHPDFCLYSRDNLVRMLGDYGTVFAKPLVSTGGKNVIRFRQADNDAIELWDENKKHKRVMPFELPQWSKEPYMLQQGIECIKVNGSYTNFRYHYQNVNGWDIIGKALMVAKHKKHIVNGAQGVNILPVTDEYPEVMMEDLGYELARQLETELPGIRELGVDFMVDEEYNVWIIEANLWPMVRIFDQIDENVSATLRKNKKHLKNLPTQNFSFADLGKPKGCKKC